MHKVEIEPKEGFSVKLNMIQKHSRRIRIEESETMPVNMFWNLVRKKDKPLIIDINGKHCKNEKLIAEKFAEHIMCEQDFQLVASEPQPSESFSSRHGPILRTYQKGS